MGLFIWLMDRKSTMNQEEFANEPEPLEISAIASRAIHEATQSFAQHSPAKAARIAKALSELHDPKHRLLHADFQEIYLADNS